MNDKIDLTVFGQKDFTFFTCICKYDCFAAGNKTAFLVNIIGKDI